MPLNLPFPAPLSRILNEHLFRFEPCAQPWRVLAGRKELRTVEHQVTFAGAFSRQAQAVAKFELGLEEVEERFGGGTGDAGTVGERLLVLATDGTVTLIEKCSGAVGFEAVATEHRWVVHISGGSVGRGDLTPDREAVGHLGSPFGRAEQMPSRPEVCGDAAEGGQEPLRMPRPFEAFHRPFALSGGLMRVLGAVVQIPR